MNTVLTVGTFAIPHMGHATFLYRASRLGRLVVGVNSDAYTTQYKGSAPVFTQNERVALLSGLPYVHEVFINEQKSLSGLLEGMRPSILCIGSDWADRYLQEIEVSQKTLDTIGCTFIYLPYTPGVSSTLIAQRLTQ